MTATAGRAQSAHDYYRAALASMQRITQPAFLTYRTTVPAGNASLVVTRGDDGRAELAIVSADSQGQSWSVAYRTADGVASIESGDGQHLISTFAMFDPTWRGAFTWIRHGIVAAETLPAIPSPAADAIPEQSPGSTPAPTAPPILAIVTAIDENNYRARNGGAYACADGRPGHRLWMAAKNDPAAHPLTAVVVDERTQRFCAMQFHERVSGKLMTFEATIELHFGDVGNYYLIVGGTIDGTMYTQSGRFPLATAFAYDQFAFPASLPPALFVPQTNDDDR